MVWEQRALVRSKIVDWCVRNVTDKGLRVIPSVNWADEASHAYCFDSTPPGQIGSIGVPYARRAHVVEYYRAGVMPCASA